MIEYDQYMHAGIHAIPKAAHVPATADTRKTTPHPVPPPARYRETPSKGRIRTVSRRGDNRNDKRFQITTGGGDVRTNSIDH